MVNNILGDIKRTIMSSTKELRKIPILVQFGTTGTVIPRLLYHKQAPRMPEKSSKHPGRLVYRLRSRSACGVSREYGMDGFDVEGDQRMITIGSVSKYQDVYPKKNN